MIFLYEVPSGFASTRQGSTGAFLGFVFFFPSTSAVIPFYFLPCHTGTS
jgi:hypothetical protein